MAREIYIFKYILKGVVFKGWQKNFNDNSFMKPAAFANISGLERSYLVAGNLAAVYRANGQLEQARNDNGTVKLGGKSIVQPGPADTGADELVRILNEIKQ